MTQVLFKLMLGAYHIEGMCAVLSIFSIIWAYFCLLNSLKNNSKAAVLANRNRKKESQQFILLFDSLSYSDCDNLVKKLCQNGSKT